MSKDFINYIKKFSLDSVLYEFGNISSLMLKRHLKGQNPNGIGSMLKFNIKTQKRYYTQFKGSIDLTAWDIIDIDYLAILKSNDYRHDKFLPQNIPEASNLYRIYENEHTDLSMFDTHIEEIFKIGLGQTSEQFRFESIGWILDNFCRNYHILVASKRINRREIVDIKKVVLELMEMPLDEFLTYELYLAWLCSQDAIPLNVLDKVQVEKGISREKMIRIIQYYSNSYSAIRDEHNIIGKQVFYSKPFVQTQKGKYIMSNLYLVLMTLGDGLYWLLRDYYKNVLDSDIFMRTFGYLFEDYFAELAEEYLFDGEWGKIPEKNDEKAADFYLEFDNFIMLLELKSGVWPIKGQNQAPDINNINKFIEDNLKEAYKQLIASEERCPGEKIVIKVILLYEFFNNIQFLYLSVPDIFKEDTRCYIMTISDLEAILNSRKNEPEKFYSILNILAEGRNEHPEFPSVLQLICYYKLESHHFYTGTRDYIKKYYDKLAELIGED